MREAIACFLLIQLNSAPPKAPIKVKRTSEKRAFPYLLHSFLILLFGSFAHGWDSSLGGFPSFSFVQLNVMAVERSTV